MRDIGAKSYVPKATILPNYLGLHHTIWTS